MSFGDQQGALMLKHRASPPCALELSIAISCVRSQLKSWQCSTYVFERSCPVIFPVFNIGLAEAVVVAQLLEAFQHSPFLDPCAFGDVRCGQVDAFVLHQVVEDRCGVRVRLFELVDEAVIVLQALDLDDLALLHVVEEGFDTGERGVLAFVVLMLGLKSAVCDSDLHMC